MNDNTSFYLTLPSNGSTVHVGKNTQSKFKIKLRQPVYLQGQYEVALVDLHYPYSFDQLSEGSFQFRESENANWEPAIISPGTYSSAEDLLTSIAASMTVRARRNIILRYHDKTQKVQLSFQEGAEIVFWEQLAHMLGFNSGKVLHGPNADNVVTSVKFRESVTAPYSVDLSAGNYSLYIYSDLVEPQFVGDSLANLLRIVNLSGDPGSIVHQSFQKPHYLPVSKSIIDTIEIHINNDQGQNVQFKKGKTICVLHFRRKKLI